MKQHQHHRSHMTTLLNNKKQPYNIKKLRTDVLGIIPRRGEEEDHQEHPARRRRMSNHSYNSSL